MTHREDDREPRRTTAERAGEAVGGVSGMTTGAAVGSLAGPLGAMIGAVAGAVGGWWAVHAATAAHTRLTPEQEAAFRARHARRPADAAGVPYERASVAYRIGFIAGCNPHYAADGFAAAERELRHAWTAGVEAELGSWEHNRDLVHEGFACAREAADATDQADSAVGPGIEPLHADPATEVANRVHDRVAHRRGPAGET